MKAAAAALLAVLVLCACAEKKHFVRVSPVAMQDARRICIIENPRVKFDFLQLYRKALQDAGYDVEVVPPTSSLGSCPVTSKYVAYWSWDLRMFLRAAQLDVYRDGRPAGSAAFQASSSSVDAEETVRGLVKQLFTK